MRARVSECIHKESKNLKKKDFFLLFFFLESGGGGGGEGAGGDRSKSIFFTKNPNLK